MGVLVVLRACMVPLCGLHDAVAAGSLGLSWLLRAPPAPLWVLQLTFWPCAAELHYCCSSSAAATGMVAVL